MARLVCSEWQVNTHATREGAIVTNASRPNSSFSADGDDKLASLVSSKPTGPGITTIGSFWFD